jgi:single-stranded-DNA-specific exonuclease
MCPLHGLNHLLTRVGLQSLSTNLKLGKRPGIESLAQVAGIEDIYQINSEHVGFQIGPRLNAAGRLGTAMKTAELLAIDDTVRAKELAKELDLENFERRNLERQIFQEAQEILSSRSPSHSQSAGQNSILLVSKSWHAGVLGIVASRCVEKYYKPTLVLTEVDGMLKGSGRSTEEINLFQLFDKHRNQFVSFGGHNKAVGLTIDPLKADWLRQVFESEVQVQQKEWASESLMNAPLHLDGLVELEEINFSLVEKLESLQPFGFGNPRPRFAVKHLKIVQCKAIGKDLSAGHCHIEVVCAKNSAQKAGSTGALRITAFSLREPLEQAFLRKSPIHIAIEVSQGTWNGKKRLELKLCDFGEAEKSAP